MLTARACNVALENGVPDWIQLLPAGPEITGQDGRSWQLPDPAPLIAAFQTKQRPLVIDWEHASEHRAPVGLDAPAAGWIDQLESRSGAIWGHVEWTDRAKQQISAKEYRFISPVFTYQKADSAIAQLVSAGLTNQPNLNLTALNRQEAAIAMNDDIMERLRYLLNLPTLATLEEVLAELDKLRARIAAEPVDTAGNRATLSTLLEIAMNHSTPPLDKFIPRPDYDAALQRASNAEAQLAAIAASQWSQQIETALNAALTAGQISPATVEFYRAGCQQEGGLERFQAFLKSAPSLLGDKPAVGDKTAAAGAHDANALAKAAQQYQHAQSQTGQTISMSDAVAHVMKGTA